MKLKSQRKSTHSPAEFAEAKLSLTRPIATGGRIVMLNQDIRAQSELVASASTKIDTNVRIARFSAEITAGELESSDAVVFEELGLAVIDHHDGRDQTSAISAELAESGEVEDSFPEFYAFAYHAEPIASAMFIDTGEFTWGLQAIGVPATKWTGDKIKVAVLDTGIDEQHPDLAGQVLVSKSFVPGEPVQDGNGHGTHCCGTISGAISARPRYGVAPGARLIVGKVLSNQGSGRQRDILAAMVWAVQQGAHIISMSLGRATRSGEAFDPAYERAGAYALANNCLVIVAAGNESDRRFGFIAPVGAPANSPSIMAVAALDQDLIEANFSCGGINGNGGEVDISAPGVDILSSWPAPRSYRAISGTSMACPHVAGAAALLAETDNMFRGAALRQALINTAVDISRNPSDVGAGLVQVP